MKKVAVLILMLVLLKLSVYSQSDFVPGYVQTTQHDTIFGLIDYRVDKSNSLECHFRKTMNDSVQTFTPTQIYGYRFSDSKYYVSRQTTDNEDLKTVFLEYLLEGVVDLYYYRDSKEGRHYLIGKKNLPLKEISLPNEIIYLDGKNYERNVLVNRNLLRFYLSDCPELYTEIDNLMYPNQKTLIKLIKRYHDIQCPNDMCMIYQKKIPKFRVDIQPVISFTKINLNLNLNLNQNAFLGTNYLSKYLFQFGVLSYFWLPLENEKLFFKTGLIIDRVKLGITDISGKVQNVEENLIKLPLQIHYQFLKTDISPVISAGINIYPFNNPFAFYPALSIGVNAKINDKLYATFSSDFDYWSPYFIIPLNSTQLVSYSVNLGLAVKL